MHKVYTFKSKVLVYPGMSGWRFLVLPKKEAKEIKDKFGKMKRGWGSLPVTVTVGNTTWETSIFPDKKSESYLLPLKVAVRKAEEIMDDDTIQFSIKIK